MKIETMREIVADCRAMIKVIRERGWTTGGSGWNSQVANPGNVCLEGALEAVKDVEHFGGFASKYPVYQALQERLPEHYGSAPLYVFNDNQTSVRPVIKLLKETAEHYEALIAEYEMNWSIEEIELEPEKELVSA